MTKRIIYCFITILLYLYTCHSSFGSFNKNMLTVFDISNQENYPKFPLNNSLEWKLKHLNVVRHDSLHLKEVMLLAQTLLKKNDVSFLRLNQQTQKLSICIGDTTTEAECYWDRAIYYYKINYKDSAYIYYNRAQKLYNHIGAKYYSAKMLLNMAIMQSDMKDYTGSEITTFKAISLFKPLKKYKQLYKCYNNLGIIYNNLQEHNKSLSYHKEALYYLKLLNEPAFEVPTTLNNIGVIYSNTRAYDKSIPIFQEALNYRGLYTKDIKLYAMILDNLTNAQFLQQKTDFQQIYNQYSRALEIRDSISDISGNTISLIHLAEFHLKTKDTTTAMIKLQKAINLANITKNYRDLQTAYELIAKLDPTNALYYLSNYIKISDSLINIERRMRNKFTRIQMETNELKSERLFLNNQLWIVTLLSFIIILIIILLLVVKKQKTQNRMLYYQEEQQRANEEIYNLLLEHESKIENAKHKEKHRIAQELHDGILGNLFGIRINLEILAEKTSQTASESRKKYINSLLTIEENIRKVSHELSHEIDQGTTSFVTLLTTLIDEQKQIGKYNCHLIFSDCIDWSALSTNHKINIYRILQETLINIHKHSKANTINIVINSINNFINITVKDNGIGFDLNKKQKGIGLRNIRSRIDFLSGKLKISTNPGNGTELHIQIPI